MKITAVCIDDSPAELDFVAGRILVAHNIQVVAKETTGTGGLAAVKRWRPTLVTLDLQLTMMHGQEVLRAIIDAKIDTLVFVASGSSQLKKTCMDMGAAAFFTKPYDDVLTWRGIEAVLKERGLLE